MAEDAVRYVVEFQIAPGSWMRTQETEYLEGLDKLFTCGKCYNEKIAHHKEERKKKEAKRAAATQAKEEKRNNTTRRVK